MLSQAEASPTMSWFSDGVGDYVDGTVDFVEMVLVAPCEPEVVVLCETA